MTAEDIISNNKIIAEFLGYKNKDGCNDRFVCKRVVDGYEKWLVLRHKNLRYHISWDWIMPVVDKIESMGYGFTKDPWGVEITEFISGKEQEIIRLERHENETNIEQYYEAVVEFIKWYINPNTVKP